MERRRLYLRLSSSEHVTCGALAFSLVDTRWFSMGSEERAWVMRRIIRAETWCPLGSCGITLGFFFSRKKRPDPVSVGLWPGKGPGLLGGGSGIGGESSLLSPLFSPLTSNYTFPDPKAELFPLPSVWPCVPHAEETNTAHEDSQH